MTQLENPFPQHIQNLGIFAPAGYPKESRDIAVGARRLENMGLRLLYPTVLPSPQRFFSAPDAQRAQALNQLLANPDVDALMALRGGYGCTRILSQIDWNLMRSRNLPVIGYSDLTAFHACALKHGCRNHIYGPMLVSTFSLPDQTPQQRENLRLTVSSLRTVLNGDDNLIAFGREKVEILQEGMADAPILPACLSVLTSLVGTPFMPDLTGYILAVEDVNEPAHRVDGYLTQLYNAGILQQLKGLIFGTFTSAEDREFIPEIQRDFARRINGPVIANLPFGHCFPALSLPVGRNVILKAENHQFSLTNSPRARYTSEIFTAETGDTLAYRWLEPECQKEGETYPLILFLHGAGERGEDNERQLIHVLPEFLKEDNRLRHPCFVAAPQCPETMQWVDTPWGLTRHTLPATPTPAMAATLQLVQELLLDYPIDPRRIYVMGLSMGGYGTWDIISRAPQTFAAAVPMCGGADLACADRLTDLPIWVFHGEKDSCVPVCRARDMVRRLQELNGRVTYTEVPGGDHNCWAPAMATPKLLPWLFRQHR